MSDKKKYIAIEEGEHDHRSHLRLVAEEMPASLGRKEESRQDESAAPGNPDNTNMKKLTEKIRQQATRIISLEKDRINLEDELSRKINELAEEKEKNESLKLKLEHLNFALSGKGKDSESFLGKEAEESKAIISTLQKENSELKQKLGSILINSAPSGITELRATVDKLTKTNLELIHYKAKTDSNSLELMRENEILNKEVTLHHSDPCTKAKFI